MATNGILFIISYLFTNTFFIHQLRYTYQNKVYSVDSWLDALITALAIDGIISLLQKLYHWMLSILYPNFPGFNVNLAKMIMGLGIVLALIICIESSICKIRYRNIPWARILIYVSLAKITIVSISFLSLFIFDYLF
jgi:hypothetical protein